MAKVGRAREPVKRVAGRPYREPTQVPLGEQPKACRGTPAEGNRQTRPVTSGEGVPALAQRAGRSDKGRPTV